ncbi:MAG: hypothetical protein PHW00_01085 [Clostridia bacterium]|nr:hypothetical protein [Clostridia bacterium]
MYSRQLSSQFILKGFKFFLGLLIDNPSASLMGDNYGFITYY